MRAAARLLAVLLLAAMGSAVAQEKHLIDPTPPGSLNPKPLPPLQNPDAPSTPAKELFARKSTPFPGPPRLFRWLPRRRCIAADHRTYLASHATVA
jgi:penicillin-insensitive murein endopeptidase